MSNLYLPGASILLSLFLVILFFSKKRYNNADTKIFQVMVVIQLLESIVETLIYFICYKDTNNITAIEFLNNFVCSFYVIWVWLFYRYIFCIAYNEQKGILKKIEFILNSIVILAIIVSPIGIVNENGVMYSYGMKPNITYIVCAFWLVCAIIVTGTNIKNINNKKYIPLWTLFLLAILIFIIRIFDPSIIIIPFALSFINLVMYFTIENPDIQMIQQLNESKDIAEKANMAKSDFLSSMSHEIRTPLNAIVGLSEDIMSHKAELPSEVLEDANDIVNASNTLLEIVGNILDINKIESDKLEIIESAYSPKEEIETLVKVLATKIGEKPIDLSLSIAPDIPHELYGDKIRVKQVVNNLLSNAIKYTDQGYIKVNVKCINQNDNCILFISVEDSGQGIKSENIKRLFNKFDRLDIERNTTTEGTGLGLAITKKLIDLMNGTINVESQFGKGSIFVAQIPQRISKMMSNEIGKTLVPSSINKVSYFGKKVLIVDDNNLNIKVAKKALDSFNFEIDEATNGQECLDLINNGKTYDLILMDIMMPIMSGETALKELQKDSSFATPVIALTADAVAGARERYMDIGFADYISKPFTKDQIKEKMDSIFATDSVVEVDRFKDVPVHVIVDNEEMY